MIYFVNVLGEYQFVEEKGRLTLKERREFSQKEQIEFINGKHKTKLSGDEPTLEQLNLILQILKGDAKKFDKIVEKYTKKAIAESVTDNNLIIQTVGMIEDFEKVTNTLSKRAREWYMLYAPEICEKISDNEGFIRAIIGKNRATLYSEFNVTEPMGADLQKSDIDEIIKFAEKVKLLYEEKREKENYLETLMRRHCPNILDLVGTMIGSKLIAFAGGLDRLSLMPAGTIQLLGAEVALFRHLKSGTRPPKHGFIITHPIVAKAVRKNKGKASRALGDKLSIAAKVDFFKGEPIGEKLRLELEKKFE